MRNDLSDKEWNELLSYFNNDELAATVWLEKYALRTDEGNCLEKSPDEMHIRLAREFSRVEKAYVGVENDSDDLSDYGKGRGELDYEKIYSYFKGFKYLVPQGSVMANLGDLQKFTSLSNCVVVPEIFDSYGGIFFSDQQLAQLYKRRCGVGVDISSLRPIHQTVKNSAGTTSGAPS